MPLQRVIISIYLVLLVGCSGALGRGAAPGICPDPSGFSTWSAVVESGGEVRVNGQRIGLRFDLDRMGAMPALAAWRLSDNRALLAAVPNWER